jgi:hypothetical protein
VPSWPFLPSLAHQNVILVRDVEEALEVTDEGVASVWTRHEPVPIELRRAVSTTVQPDACKDEGQPCCVAYREVKIINY